jgi:hypothetical protein
VYSDLEPLLLQVDWLEILFFVGLDATNVHIVEFSF